MSAYWTCQYCQADNLDSTCPCGRPDPKDTLITQLQGEVERLNKECQHYASNPCGDRNHIGLTHVLCNLPGGRLPNPQLGQDSAMAAHIIGSLESEVTRLTTLLEKAKHYLERLARLGNEPHLGNSRGNELAQEVLRLLEGKEPR